MPGRPPAYPRPINPFDNPSTTGLAVNPNGTYVANPYPTTAAIGQTGQYGAGLPQVNVGGGGRLPTQGGSMESYNVNAFLQNIIPNIHNAVMTYNTPMPTVPYALPAVNVSTPKTAPATTFSSAAAAASGMPYNSPTPRPVLTDPGPLYQGGGGVLDSYNYMLTGVADRIAKNPAEYDNLSPAQRDAIDSLIAEKSGMGEEAGGGGGGYDPKNTDPRNTAAYKYYAENNIGFMDQKRWDPQSKKFVSIGKLIKQGKLDIRTGKFNKRGNKQHQRRQGKRSNPVQAGPAETTGGFTGSYGVVSFNTGTG